MSRFRTLKEEKIKNRMKSISFVLALALLIGSVQGLGTYALFNDTEDIASNLAISTGDVDVEVSVIEGETVLEEGIISNIGDGIEFEIANKGTLNQNICLKITSESLGQELDNIVIYFDPEKNPDIDISNIDNINLNADCTMLKKETDSTKLFVLSPGQIIKGLLYVAINSSIEPQKEYDLNLQVNASQINKSNNLQIGGFYDVDIQKNTIKINNKNSVIMDDYNVFVSWNKEIDISYNKKYGTGLIEAIEMLNGNGLNAQTGKIVAVSGSGKFKDALYKLKTDKITITNVTTRSLESEYEKGNHIIIQFEYDNNLTEYYRVDFRKDFAFIVHSIAAKVTKVSEQEFKAGNNLSQSKTLSEGEIAEQSKEETSNEVEVVEPTKEENKAPSEEVVQPSTEEIEVPSEEVVQPSIEEIEAPGEEVVEPSTEEIEAPGEEVVEPSTEEIEAPSEEVVDPSTGEIEVPSEVVEPTTEEIEAPNEIEVILPSKEETEIEE